MSGVLPLLESAAVKEPLVDLDRVRDCAIVSAAISLKRIADALEKGLDPVALGTAIGWQMQGKASG